MPSNLWDEILAHVEHKVSRYIFHTWFKPTKFIENDDNAITVLVPNDGFKQWLTRHYAGVIKEAADELGRSGTTISLITGDSAPADRERDAGASPNPPEPAPRPPAQQRYTFEEFVVGPSNQFAHAAARAVAEAPARSYNPLFIYGGVGLGKTHLMHAIGEYLDVHSPQSTRTYISSDRFMNEMINAIRFDRTIDFRARYRNTDILLVDDIQFLASREGTQIEFFHTFNSLYDAQKQIVISSDCPPHEIQQLEERLRSRFEWGLIADIQSPDLETKIAILKKKAEAETVPLPDDVALYIASGIKSNVRELEGSLIRLIAYASLTGNAISLTLAQDVLRNILHRDEQPVTIGMVQKFIANYYRLKLADLKGRNSSKAVARPRQIAMFLCRTLTDASLPQIGKSFGRDHSTVVHSIRKVEGQCKTDREFHNLVNSFIETFR
jgi:chromosomal replication initiator protein